MNLGEKALTAFLINLYLESSTSIRESQMTTLQEVENLLQEVENFRVFASTILDQGAKVSFQQPVELWEAGIVPDDLFESVAAVKLALAEMESGEKGMPLEEHLAKIRAKFSV